MVDLINIDFEDVENYYFENMFEMANMSQMLNVLGNELWWVQWWWDKTSAQTEPFPASKDNKICLILFCCNCYSNFCKVLYYNDR